MAQAESWDALLFSTHLFRKNGDKVVFLGRDQNRFIFNLIDNCNCRRSWERKYQIILRVCNIRRTPKNTEEKLVSEMAGGGRHSLKSTFSLRLSFINCTEVSKLSEKGQTVNSQAFLFRAKASIDNMWITELEHGHVSVKLYFTEQVQAGWICQCSWIVKWEW